MNKNSQAGNAIIYILIAIALFAALAYVFMRGARTGQGNLTMNQAKLGAQEIVAKANAFELYSSGLHDWRMKHQIYI